jgi:TRAP-type mannitol/chloroaromatic compound transport system substrate-binding protein
LAAADIYQALERGVIDATEFSMPAMDIKLDLHQIAKFNYFPSWNARP